MWLLYLRFAKDTQIQTTHVLCLNKREVGYVLNLANQHGFTPETSLVEYAKFYSRATIKSIEVPNFHVHDINSFAKAWGITALPVHV